MSAARTGLWGILAEFETPAELLRAAGRVREAGYQNWDCYSPFPVHGLDRVMGLRDTRVPWVILGAGAVGTSLAILMQWWMNAIDYPLNISGKPLFSLPAQIPIVFELTVLLASITAFLAVFAFNSLPQFFHPTFRSRRFKRVTTDRFFITIESSDAKFEVDQTEAMLRSLGSSHVEWLED